MIHPTSNWKFKGTTYQFTWINDSNVNRYIPCTQAYGICFTKKGQILLIDHLDMRMIPGGTPEGKETPKEALRRELIIEEADVLVSEVIPLGVQKVTEKGNSKSIPYYQYRYVCLIKKLLPRTPDPDNGIIHPRILVPASKVTEHVKWGITGDTMFKEAIDVFNRHWRQITK